MTLYIFDRCSDWPVIKRFSCQICLVSGNVNLSSPAQHPSFSSIICKCIIYFVMVCFLCVMSSCPFISCFFFQTDFPVKVLSLVSVLWHPHHQTEEFLWQPIPQKLFVRKHSQYLMLISQRTTHPDARLIFTFRGFYESV